MSRRTKEQTPGVGKRVTLVDGVDPLTGDALPPRAKGGDDPKSLLNESCLRIMDLLCEGPMCAPARAAPVIG